MKDIDAKIAELPQWAREHIAAMDAEIRDLTDRLARLPGTSKTDVSIGRYPDYRYLPGDTQVGFRLAQVEGAEEVRATLGRKRFGEPRCLVLESFDVLRIEPQTQYCIHIYLRD
jgi:hypothetical protein